MGGASARDRRTGGRGRTRPHLGRLAASRGAGRAYIAVPGPWPWRWVGIKNPALGPHATSASDTGRSAGFPISLTYIWCAEAYWTLSGRGSQPCAPGNDCRAARPVRHVSRTTAVPGRATRTETLGVGGFVRVPLVVHADQAWRRVSCLSLSAQRAHRARPRLEGAGVGSPDAAECAS